MCKLQEPRAAGRNSTPIQQSSRHRNGCDAVQLGLNSEWNVEAHCSVRDDRGHSVLHSRPFRHLRYVLPPRCPRPSLGNQPSDGGLRCGESDTVRHRHPTFIIIVVIFICVITVQSAVKWSFDWTHWSGQMFAANQQAAVRSLPATTYHSTQVSLHPQISYLLRFGILTRAKTVGRLLCVHCNF